VADCWVDVKLKEENETMKRIILSILAVLILSSVAQAKTRSVTVEWDYANGPSDLAGFVMYKDGVKLSAFNNPTARTFTGDLDMSDADACYTLTAIDAGGQESQHSPCYQYDPPPDDAPGNVRVTVVVEVQAQATPK